MEYFGFKSVFFLSFQDSAIVLSGVRLDQFQYTFLHILSIGNIFFLPGVSLSSNYIPLVNEVNLQIIITAVWVTVMVLLLGVEN